MKSKSIYSANKVSRHPAQLGAACGKLPMQPPVHAQLILSDLCNQDCQWCAYRQSGFTTNQLFSIGELAKTGTNNPKRMIPDQRALDLIRELSAFGVKAVQLTGGGEPSVHPKFAEVSQSIINRGMKLALVSNGVAIKPKHREILKHATWVRISIDSPDVETYCNLRRVSALHYHAAWNTVRELAKLHGPTLGVGYVISPQNWTGLAKFVGQAADAGAQNVRFSAMQSIDGADAFAGQRERINNELDDALAVGQSRGVDVYARFEERVSEMDNRVEFDRCGYQYFTTYLGGDQNIYRCCNTAYNYVGKLSSFAQQPFAEAWAEAQDKLRTFDPRKNCNVCQFTPQNKQIIELTAPTDHEEFV